MNNIEIPLVSVLVPSFNHSKYVIECLESVRDSDYNYLELIVIDDGSTDNSVELIDSWLNRNKSHFARTVFIQQENAGICKTLNKLVKIAHGAFLVIVASDDKLLSHGISIRVAALQENPDWLAVYGDCTLIDSSGEILANSAMTYLYKANKQALINSNFIARELILHWSVPGPVFMARRKCYDTTQGVGLYNEGSSFEDRDYYLRLLSKRALGYIDLPVAAYRLHGSNISRNVDFEPHLISTIHKSNFDRINDFQGLTQLCLKIVTVRSYCGYIVHEDKNIINLTKYFIARVITVIAYKIHTIMVYSNYSYIKMKAMFRW